MWSVAIKPIMLLVMLSVVDEGKDIKSVCLSLSLSACSLYPRQNVSLSICLCATLPLKNCDKLKVSWWNEPAFQNMATISNGYQNRKYLPKLLTMPSWKPCGERPGGLLREGVE
jgi:hypothetical protein